MNKFIDKFKQGINYTNIKRPVTKNDLYQIDDPTNQNTNYKYTRFIPASGAATRMFKELYNYQETNIKNDYITTFIKERESFAFNDFIKEVNPDEYINSVLNQYGHLPKALIEVHKYSDFNATPIDEHINEMIKTIDSDNINIHFTISKEHETLFKNFIIKYNHSNITITYSFQKKETDTLAVDLNNNPITNKDGSYLYRPGGHGALIHNLNEIDSDVIMIKNIDNIVHRNHLQDTINSYGEILKAGNSIKTKLDKHLKDLLSKTYNKKDIISFVEETLHITHENEWTEEMLIKFLDRPLRICGMVKNTGEPGGGPFVVQNENYTDLQICELSELNRLDNQIEDKISKANYFNPVNLICYVKNYQGSKYNLTEYINEDRYFISQKSHHGKDLKALEHPGLWNGAMHNWNTVFMEVPLTTFNPIKTVNDLLRKGHQE